MDTVKSLLLMQAFKCVQASSISIGRFTLFTSLRVSEACLLKSLFTAMKSYRETERERRVKSKSVMRDNFTRGKEEHHSVEGSQASPALPSVRGNKKMKMYEDIRVVTVAARNKGREILISR